MASLKTLILSGLFALAFGDGKIAAATLRAIRDQKGINLLDESVNSSTGAKEDYRIAQPLVTGDASISPCGTGGQTRCFGNPFKGRFPFGGFSTGIGMDSLGFNQFGGGYGGGFGGVGMLPFRKDAASTSNLGRRGGYPGGYGMDSMGGYGFNNGGGGIGGYPASSYDNLGLPNNGGYPRG